jgi:hypothetical protein
MIYICILYLKSLETYLETLHSHFQPNCYFKMFKNSGSGLSSLATVLGHCFPVAEKSATCIKLLKSPSRSVHYFSVVIS